MTAEEVIRLMNLKPLPDEGGYYRESYRSAGEFIPAHLESVRAYSTAIFYLLTPDQFSALHRLKGDEVFHFYAGDTVEMLTLSPGGKSSVVTIGSKFDHGELPQFVVPAGTWQGSRLKDGGAWALLGTTVAPGFEFADFEMGDQGSLIREYPASAELIQKLSRC